MIHLANPRRMNKRLNNLEMQTDKVQLLTFRKEHCDD